MLTKLIRQRVDNKNGIWFRPFSMAFWLCVCVLGFVCALPFLPVSGAPIGPGFVRMIAGDAENTGVDTGAPPGGGGLH
jgi:hypothetical protein